MRKDCILLLQPLAAPLIDLGASGEGLAAHIYLDNGNTKMAKSTKDRWNPNTWPLPRPRTVSYFGPWGSSVGVEEVFIAMKGVKAL